MPRSDLKRLRTTQMLTSWEAGDKRRTMPAAYLSPQKRSWQVEPGNRRLVSAPLWNTHSRAGRPYRHSAASSAEQLYDYQLNLRLWSELDDRPQDIPLGQLYALQQCQRQPAP